MSRDRHLILIPRMLTVFALAAVTALGEEKSASAPNRIVVSIPDHKLVLLQGERVLRVYEVAVGKPSTPSPEGEFTIVNRVKDPTWYGHGKVVGPGKANPLGTRWMGLSRSGYGIHGTNAPSSIGKHASHGCIRMRNPDAEELFDLVSIGVTVELNSQRPEAVQRILSVAD